MKYRLMDEKMADSASSSSNNSPAGKKRRRTMERHSWTEGEELIVLEYARKLFKEGKEYEKPAATEYYRKFQKTCTDKGLADIPLDKLVQHMKNLKRLYVKAVEFRRNYQQGLLNGTAYTDTTVDEHVYRICKHFNYFDEMLGSKPQLSPAFVSEEWVEPMIVVCKEEIPWTDETNSPTPVSESNSPTPMGEWNSPAPVDEWSCGTPLGGPNSPTLVDESNDERNCTTPVEALPEVEQNGDTTTKRKRVTPVKNASKALEAAMWYRYTADMNRLKWEKRCWEMERQSKKEERAAQMALEDKALQLKSQQLQFEKQKWDDEMEHKRKVQEDAFQLEELKLKNEMELRKLELEKKYQLEMLKRNEM